MRINELHTKWEDIHYRNNWLIRYSTQPIDGVYVARAFKKLEGSKLDGASKIEETGKTQKEAVSKLKFRLEKILGPKKMDSGDVIRSTIDINVPMQRELFGADGSRPIRIVKEGGKLYLDVATEEWVDAFGDDSQARKAYGFKPVDERGRDKRGVLIGYQVNYTPAQIEALGLEFNARYTLEPATSDDPEAYTRYGLEYHSMTDPEGRESIGVPAIIVAAWTKKG